MKLIYNGFKKSVLEAFREDGSISQPWWNGYLRCLRDIALLSWGEYIDLLNWLQEYAYMKEEEYSG